MADATVKEGYEALDRELREINKEISRIGLPGCEGPQVEELRGRLQELTRRIQSLGTNVRVRTK